MLASGGGEVVVVECPRMRYGARDVLDGLAFRVRRSEVVALLGPNGAGKPNIGF